MTVKRLYSCPAAPMITDPAAFIRAETRLLPVPHAPELSLHVADEATELWQRTEEELGEIGLPPPFWAFAWAGGQALARYILDHPETVRGNRVLDFASGSGLVAIAAMKAGAAEVARRRHRRVRASPHRPQRRGQRRRCRRPMQAYLIGTDRRLGHVWPAISSTNRISPRGSSIGSLRSQQRGASVLIGDPGRTYLPKTGLTALAAYSVPVTRDPRRRRDQALQRLALAA